MRVMGIDPGETTGWAVCDVIDTGVVVLSYGQINCEDLLTSGFTIDQPHSKYVRYRAVALALMQIVAAEAVEVCVIEDFTLRQMTTTKAEGISPVRIGAMLEVWLNDIMPTEHPDIRVAWQTPSQAKTVVNDKRMKALGLWIPGNPHACDAVRHVDLYRRRIAGEMKYSE